MRQVLLIFAVSIFAALWSAAPAVSGYPTCAPTADEELVIVQSASYKGFASAGVSDGTDKRTWVIDLDVKPGRRPIYLVLSDYNPVIWRLSGATEQISRVVALGAINTGWQHVGVVGAPRHKVIFPPIDTEIHAQSEPRMEGAWPSPKACDPSNFLFRLPSSHADGRAVVLWKTFPIQSAAGAAFATTEKLTYEVPFDVVAAGPVPPRYFDSPEPIQGSYYGDGDGSISVRKLPAGQRYGDLVQINPEDVVSPIPVVPYETR